MLYRQRRAERCHGMGDPGLMQRNRVEVAFHHNHGLRSGDRFARLIECKQRLALFE